MICGLCRGTGWVIDSNPGQRPIVLYLIPCPVPDCEESEREVESLILLGQWKDMADRVVLSLVPVAR